MEEERIRKKEKDRREIRRVGKRDENEYISSSQLQNVIRTRIDRESRVLCFFGFFFLSLSHKMLGTFLLPIIRKKKKEEGCVIRENTFFLSLRETIICM